MSTGGNGGIVVQVPPDAGKPDDMVPPDASCATGMQATKITPVNMFIQFDNSGSMTENNKWADASSALIGFFKDPAAAGLRVALRFFPDPNPVPGCSRDLAPTCNADACATPLVGLGELTAESAPADAQEEKLVTATMTTMPVSALPADLATNGGTPMSAALEGALKWAAANQTAKPMEKTVVVLVTDGVPSGCDTNIGAISNLASGALAASGVPTYVIGLQGSQENQLNQIARAGGTMQAFFVGSANATQQLITALNTIRGSVLTCQFPVPTGSNVDPKKVNVNYTPSNGMTEVIGQAPDAMSCANGGWYYDNPTAPTTITLCDSTCKRVQADTSPKLDIVLGCTAIPVPPPR